MNFPNMSWKISRLIIFIITGNKYVMENITPISRQCAEFVAELISKSNSSMPPLCYAQCQLQGHFCYSTGGDLGTVLTLRTLGGQKVRLIPTWALNTSPAVGQTYCF